MTNLDIPGLLKIFSEEAENDNYADPVRELQFS